MLSAGFLMVHDAVRRRQHQVPELARRQQIGAVFLNVRYCHIVPEGVPHNNVPSLSCGCLFNRKTVHFGAYSQSTK